MPLFIHHGYGQRLKAIEAQLVEANKTLKAKRFQEAVTLNALYRRWLIASIFGTAHALIRAILETFLHSLTYC